MLSRAQLIKLLDYNPVNGDWTWKVVALAVNKAKSKWEGYRIMAQKAAL